MSERVVFDEPLAVSKRDEAVIQAPRFRVESTGPLQRQRGVFGCPACGGLIPYPDVTLCATCFPPPPRPLTPEEALRRIVEQLSVLVSRPY